MKITLEECISNKSCFIVAGVLISQFGMEKGLKQGDHISPILFNIVVEGLNCLLQEASNLGLIEGEKFKDSKGLLKDGSKSARVIKKGLQTMVGCGERADFWSDICLDGRPLKETFLMCFALAVKKLGMVQDFGNWVEENWATDLVKYMIVWWFKNLGKGSNESIDSLLRNIKDLCVDNFKVKKLKIVDWIPPFVDNQKFNIDGSSKGKPGPSGIGGVLRDSNGKVICPFPAYSGILDSNVAEFRAIHRAIELCVSNPMLRGRDIC
ncbi:hypothetical protein Ddye_032117 [Dipteronia dyeriana]|uniref:RNase H type-1 domain-containing protein n=1 Tax=Dipteronia dyeriana TaxID=168575 RepID=A0AAD9TJK5_9ROSI|nr:hypothetical protein Ddye_032117 [Dipteronia dyeriana]